MALADDVALRYTDAFLIPLTNPHGGLAPTTVDSTKLAQAASSIEEWFETYAEEPYLSTVGIHVEVGVKGVVGLLREWSAGTQEGSQAFWDSFKAECDRVRNTRSRGRVIPSTTSTSQHSTDGRTTRRPVFDDEQFSFHIPNEPRVDTSETDD